MPLKIMWQFSLNYLRDERGWQMSSRRKWRRNWNVYKYGWKIENIYLYVITFLRLGIWLSFLNWYIGERGGVQLDPLGTAATNVPASGDYVDGEIGGMMIGRGNRSSRIKPAPVPLCPPQTPHTAGTWIRAATVESQQLTAWTTARPKILPCRESNPGRPARSPSLYWLSYPGSRAFGY
jgi:hypothetical protein